MTEMFQTDPVCFVCGSIAIVYIVVRGIVHIVRATTDKGND